MRKVLYFLTLLLLSSSETHAKARQPYLIHPFFSFFVPYKGVEASAESLYNMRLGCTATVKPDVALKDCMELADKLHSLVSFANEEIKHAELVGGNLTQKEKEELFDAIYKKYEEAKAVSAEITKRFPYVRFYIAPQMRLAI
jgi:hypothetical protein